MAKTGNYAVENEMGCGLVGAIFQRGGIRLKKPSVPPLPANRNNNAAKISSTSISKRQRGATRDITIKSATLDNNPSPRPSTSLHQHQNSKRNSDAARNSTSSTKNSGSNNISQVVNLAYTRRLRKEPTFKSGDLSLTISNHKTPNVSDMLYRASSNNVMLSGHLGNLKQPQNPRDNHHNPVKTTRNVKVETTTFITGNILRKPNGGSPQLGNIFSRVMNKLDPEVLKTMGNESYKVGKFEEALALYNQAISLDPGKASYYSNKSAAFMSLGHLIEAVFECRKAIQIDPSYHNAHYRLARLYHRLGEAEKALFHYKCSGYKAGTKDIAEAQALKTHHGKCTEAQKLKDWNTLLKESQNAFSFGADSAQKIYAMQSEALLKLHRHQEAYTNIHKGPNYNIQLCTRFFGSADTAYLLIIRSQVYMAAGRFEDAVGLAQRATRIDSSNEVDTIVKRARAIATARSTGNQLFKESKFSEACVVYIEGLEQEPYNSVLLCNRAACRSKLGQFEKAVEDCTTALNVQPSYSKARLRRANCNAKLEKWEAAIQDYEILIQEIPGNEEVGKALFEAKIQLKKQHSNDINDANFDHNLIHTSSNEHISQIAQELKK